MIMGVEEAMSLVAVGRIFEILLVNRGNLLVIGRSADFEAAVVTIEARRTHRNDFVGLERMGLTCAIDTAARASHDFDDMIFLLAFANHLADLVGIGETKDLAEIELDAGDFDFCFADAFGTTEGLEIEVFGFLARELFSGKADDGFGHAAGGTVNDASTGFEAHRIVAGLFGQAVEVNAELADEIGQLCGRHRDIDIADAVVAEFFARDFELLGRARHDRDDEDVLVVFAEFFGKDAAEHRGAHLLRGFAAGEVAEHILLILFGVFDPCGTARREDREIFALGDATEDFGAFFNCREVGGESRIADEIEAEAVHGGNHFAHDRRAGLESEFFAEANADCGGNLCDDEFVGIVNGSHDFVIVAVADDGTGRADGSALTAVHAIDFSEGQAESRLNNRVIATFGEAEHADALDFGASADAIATEDAFAGIADERWGGFVDGTFETEFLEGDIVDVVTACEFLQTAFATLRAGRAVDIVIGEKELQCGLAHAADGIGVCFNNHSIARCERTAGDNAQTFAFDKTHTASTENGKAGVIAKGRNINAVVAAELKNVLLPIDGIGTTVDDH